MFLAAVEMSVTVVTHIAATFVRVGNIRLVRRSAKFCSGKNSARWLMPGVVLITFRRVQSRIWLETDNFQRGSGNSLCGNLIKLKSEESRVRAHNLTYAKYYKHRGVRRYCQVRERSNCLFDNSTTKHTNKSSRDSNIVANTFGKTRMRII